MHDIYFTGLTMEGEKCMDDKPITMYAFVKPNSMQFKPSTKPEGWLDYGSSRPIPWFMSSTGKELLLL